MTGKDKETDTREQEREPASKVSEPPRATPADAPRTGPADAPRTGPAGPVDDRERASALPRWHVPKGIEEPQPRMAPDALLDLIAAADKVEIAFADHDGAEITDFPRVEIPPGVDSWQQMSGGLALAESAGALEVHGAGPLGRPVHVLEQYLLILDGAEVEHAWRPEPLAISAGMTFDLRNDMVF